MDPVVWINPSDINNTNSSMMYIARYSIDDIEKMLSMKFRSYFQWSPWDECVWKRSIPIKIGVLMRNYGDLRVEFKVPYCQKKPYSHGKILWFPTISIIMTYIGYIYIFHRSSHRRWFIIKFTYIISSCHRCSHHRSSIHISLDVHRKSRYHHYIITIIPHDGSMVLLYMVTWIPYFTLFYHQYTPVMLAYIPAPCDISSLSLSLYVS